LARAFQRPCFWLFGTALSLLALACTREPERTPASAAALGPSRDDADCPAGPFAAPLPESPVVTRVAGVPPPGYGSGASSNVEGPLWLDGALYVSHLQEGVTNPPPSRILKISGVVVEEFLRDAGTNGLALGNDGVIVGARHADGSLSRLDLATKTFAPFVRTYQGARFGSPNDIAIRSDGNLYFSDPAYQAPAPPPQPQTRVYRVDPTGAVSVVDATRVQPNGVTLSLDERTLYVASAEQGGVHRYPVAADGSVGPGAPFVPTGSDGMGLDCADNLYLTSDRDIVIIAPNGTTVGTLKNAVPEGASTTNVAFGGADRKRLFITARGEDAGLWYVDLQIPGKPY
jgi:gluconolactonase